MDKPTEHDHALAAEIFNGDSVDWYQQAVDVIARARSEEHSRMTKTDVASDVLRIQLTDAARNDLRIIERELHLGIDGAIGIAIGTEAFLLKQISKGKRVMLVGEEGRQFEVILKMDGAGEKSVKKFTDF